MGKISKLDAVGILIYLSLTGLVMSLLIAMVVVVLKSLIFGT